MLTTSRGVLSEVVKGLQDRQRNDCVYLRKLRDSNRLKRAAKLSSIRKHRTSFIRGTRKKTNRRKASLRMMIWTWQAIAFLIIMSTLPIKSSKKRGSHTCSSFLMSRTPQFATIMDNSHK